MPTEKTKDYFAFSVATKKGTSPGGFGELMNEIVGSRIKLHSLSAFVSGRRTKVFCVPDDPETFRAFAKKRGLRVSRKSASVCTGVQLFKPRRSFHLPRAVHGTAIGCDLRRRRR